MSAIGMGLLWSGYVLGIWGYCQLTGYQISLAEIAIPGRYTGTWPPPMYGAGDTGPGVQPKVDPSQHPGDLGYPGSPYPVT